MTQGQNCRKMFSIFGGNCIKACVLQNPNTFLYVQNVYLLILTPASSRRSTCHVDDLIQISYTSKGKFCPFFTPSLFPRRYFHLLFYDGKRRDFCLPQQCIHAVFYTHHSILFFFQPSFSSNKTFELPLNCGDGAYSSRAVSMLLFSQILMIFCMQGFLV